MTAKGERARPTWKGVKGAGKPPQPEKMLSAIYKMSNIFLHLGLNIEIVQIKIFLRWAKLMEAGGY